MVEWFSRKVWNFVLVFAIVIGFFLFSNFFLSLFFLPAPPASTTILSQQQTTTNNDIQTIPQHEEQTNIKSTTTLSEDDFYTNIPSLSSTNEQLIISQKSKFSNEISKISNGCPNNYIRDFHTEGIFVQSVFQGPYEKCDIKCEGGYRGDYDAFSYEQGASRSRKCGHEKSIYYTMENTHLSQDFKHKDMWKDDLNIIATTKLNSDVPVPYFSWAEYSFMTPRAKQVKKLFPDQKMMAVFISNCGSLRRLQILDELEKYGVTYDSFGACKRNRNIPSGGDVPTTGGFLSVKNYVASHYKFLYTPENSETDDYVTEKLFGTLSSSSSIPVYFGPGNVKKFLPDPNYSIINVNDFKSIQELAEYIKRVDQDEELYNRYFDWKIKGPSKDFIAMVDLAIVHSVCRLCIRVADLLRIEYQNTIGHEPLSTVFTSLSQKYPWIVVKVRERGTFWLKNLYLNSNSLSLDYLFAQIFKRWNKQTKGNVYKVYRMLDNEQVALNEEEVKNLKHGDELEIIFEDPLNEERGNYYQWYKAQQQKKI